MRLHHLAITAFGPFAGSEDVDLDALSSSGLFLIHGPTGAGKTSILDAICFALYAAVPGARAGSRSRLRSDHAAEGVVPEVTLDSTASGRRLRVCRSPEFSRPKKRGTGRITVPAKVVLDELTGGKWVNRGTRNDEVAMTLKDILGMGLEQFITVVLLPQGDFAAFLRASPEDRRVVLEKLFDTQRFADVETWLAERRRQTSTVVVAARDALSTGLVRVDDVIARLDGGDDLVAPDWSRALHPVADLVPADGSQDPAAAQDVGTVLATLAAAVDLRASTALASVEVARSRVIQSESAVHQGTAVLGHLETAAQARASLSALDEQHDTYLESVTRLDLAERAGAVGGFVAAARSADLTREAALTQVADLRAPLCAVLEFAVAEHKPAGNLSQEAPHDAGCEVAGDPVHQGPHHAGHKAAGGLAPDVDATLVRSLVEELAAQSDALQQAAAQDRQGRRLAKESARHDQAALVADGRSASLTRQREQAQRQRAVAEESRDASRVADAEIPALEARHKTLTRIRQLLDEQERSAGEVAALSQRADQADRLVLEMRERLVDLRERRLAGLAAELANGLSTGDPCPVCGSCVHPMPAMTNDVVSQSDIQLAEDDVTGAGNDLSATRASVSAAQARREGRSVELRTHLEGLPSLAGGPGEKPMTAAADVLAAVSRSAAMISAARTAASALPGAQHQLEALVLEAARLQDLTEACAAAKASALALAATSRLQSRVAGAEVADLLATHSRVCPCSAGEPAGESDPWEVAKVAKVAEVTEVTDVHGRHRETLDRLRSLATGLDELVTHQANARDAVRRLSVALQDHGLENMEQARAVALPPAGVAELTAFLRAIEGQRAQANALLAQPDVLAALMAPTPDVGALALAHQQAATSLDDASRRHTFSEQAQRELKSLTRTVHRALNDLGPAQAEARLVQELADCIAGHSADNVLRMRLSSYVLAARLAEIATLANERLITMGDGRYTLEYSDARAAKGARSGLGLLVRDAWTGQSRETSSLSGGEAFMASLALALGMGDAVRAEAGGFDLQTLFVDEGFGSLDEESLEQVMAVLDTLREGGRAVGIVSHVTELRTRIPHQLQVLKQQEGSRIRIENRDSPAA
ncbi:MAG: SMC family ATPase [Dermatophilaceae bacterium]|nr:SMC family ATPase [Dermatophilaceae bacterium]